VPDNSFARRPQDVRSLAIGYAAVLVAGAGLYLATAARGAQWQDSGEFILRVLDHDWIGRLGLALSHPIHHGLGRLAVAVMPTEPAFAVTTVSALAAALTLANLYGCVLTLTGRPAAAALAAASLGLANTFWHMAAVAEVYTVNTALLAAECWCVAACLKGRHRWILAAWLLNGLGTANHLQAVLTLPALAWITLRGLRAGHWTPRALPGAAALWTAGASPYLWLVVAQGLASGEWGATLRQALFGIRYSQNVLNTAVSPRLLATSAAFIAFNFPNLLLALAVRGLFARPASSDGRSVHVFLLLALCAHAAFALRYNVVDQHTFFLPMYLLICVFAGIGVSKLLERWSRRRARLLLAAAWMLLALTPAWYAAGTAVARRLDLLGDRAHRKPWRDDYAYLLLPWAAFERSADLMSRHAAALAGPEGLIVVEDSMAMPAVRYRLRVAGRDGVQAVFPPRDGWEGSPQSDLLYDEAGRRRRVVLVPLNADHPRTPCPAGSWRRDGDLYVMEAAPAETSPATAHAPDDGPATAHAPDDGGS